MQNTDAAGRGWEVAYSGNITCKCDLPGPNTVNQRIIYHQFNRTGKSHATWVTLQVFWGRAHFHGSIVLFCMSLLLNTVLIQAIFAHYPGNVRQIFRYLHKCSAISEQHLFRQYPHTIRAISTHYSGNVSQIFRHTLIKKKTTFSSFIRKSTRELQSN